MKTEIIEKLKHLPNDRIGEDIYTAFEWCNGQLVRIYIGSKTNGPMLQYDAYGFGKYNGIDLDFKNGCWTNCYSRGNFGKKYAFGGNWSGHNKNLHPKLMVSPIIDRTNDLLITEDEKLIELPTGFKGDITQIEMDCSGGWSIWYSSAKNALANRLTAVEIKQSALPEITKQHLLKNETSNVIDCLKDVIEAYEL